MKRPLKIVLSLISAVATVVCVLCILFLVQYFRGQALNERLSSSVLTGIITIACGLLPRDAFPAFAVLCGLMAIPCSWFNAPTMTLAQRNVPEEKLGRVMGLMTAGFGLASPIGVALGGALAEGIGVAPFFVVDGLLCIILGAAMYLPREIRALDRDQSRS